MAKFTIYFKDKAIKSYIYDSGTVHIGRDDFNDLVVDNPDVAPAHAVILIKVDSYIIKQLNESHPLIVNNEKINETILQNNDVITVGKHTITFNVMEFLPSNTDESSDLFSGNQEKTTPIPTASLQILDGPHIGKILPLKKTMTRLGHEGSGIIIISKRKEGYFLSSLENNSTIIINQEPLTNETIHLKTNDIVLINNISMQFF